MIKKIGSLFKVGTQNLNVRYDWIVNELSLLPDKTKILDAGAGETKFKKYCERLAYTSQDFAQYDGIGNHEGMQTKAWDNTKLDIVSDITNIPVEDRSFEAIMCIEVFEHIPDPIQAIKEFSRILKSGGTLLLTVPCYSVNHFAPYYFYVGFSKYWLEKYLNDLGFTNIEIEENGSWFEVLAQEIRRLHRFIELYISKNKFLFYLSKITALPLVIFLQYLTNKDNKSKELLCFGYNVKAIKK